MLSHAAAWSVLVPWLALLPSAPLAGQSADTSGRKTFFVATDALWLGAFGLGSYGVSRFDPRVTKYFQQPRNQSNHTMRKLAESFTRVHETTLTIGGLVTYGIARWTGGRDVQDIALHATEAIVGASLTSQVIRGPLGRARPKDARPRFEDQYEFHWFNGFRNFEYRAYPSIHSASAFAAATVVVVETHRRSPHSTWYVAPLAYAIAAGPGYSRVYLGQHWASDIFMGAFIGTFYGMRVVDYNHAHPDNKVDRFFLGAPKPSGLRILPQPRGMTLLYGREF